MVKIPPSPHFHVKPPEFEWNDYMMTCSFSTELIIHFQSLLRECLAQGYKAAIESGGPSYERTFCCYPVPLQFKPIFQQRLEELIFGEVQNREVVKMKTDEQTRENILSAIAKQQGRQS